MTPALLCSTGVVIGCSSELFIFCCPESGGCTEYHTEDSIVYLFYNKISGMEWGTMEQKKNVGLSLKMNRQGHKNDRGQ